MKKTPAPSSAVSAPSPAKSAPAPKAGSAKGKDLIPAFNGWPKKATPLEIKRLSAALAHRSEGAID